MGVTHHINPNINTKLKAVFIVPSLKKQLYLKSKKTIKITSYLVQLIVHQLMGKPWAGLLFLKAFTWILFCCLVILIDTRPEIQSSKELSVVPTGSRKSCWKAGRYKWCITPKIFLLLCCPLLSHPILSSTKDPASNQRPPWLKTVLKHKPNRKKF